MEEKTVSEVKANPRPEEDTIEGQTYSLDEQAYLDESEIFLRRHGYTKEYLLEALADKARNRRLVRRVDMVLLPLMAGVYTLQFIDKQAMSYAAVFDLMDSTGTTANQYSWFGSIFYLAYLVAEYPWAYLAQKTLMGKVVAGCVITWGSILMMTAACHNFAGLATCRFFLGVFEAPITPIFYMIVAMWYTREQQPFRAGVFYSCNGVGLMLGGLLSYGIGQINGFAIWRAIFLICGGMTVAFGGLLLWFLPDDILSAKIFSLDEKAVLIGRARLARTGVLNRTFKWSQVREALVDPQVWLLTLFVLLNEVINGGVANFGSLIIKGLVHNSLLSVVLGIPQGAFQVFWILTGCLLASKVKNIRTIIMAVYLIPTILGVSLMWKLDRQSQKIGLLFGYYMVTAYVTSLVLALQLPSSNLGGYTKRVTGTALVFAAYCAGNVIGPHAFIASEAPVYPTGSKVMLACSVAQFFLALLLRWLLVARNKKRDAAAAASAAGPDTTEETPLEEIENGQDLTDFQNPHFRYVL